MGLCRLCQMGLPVLPVAVGRRGAVPRTCGPLPNKNMKNVPILNPCFGLKPVTPRLNRAPLDVHLQVWDDMVLNKVPSAYVFEEDVVFHEDLSSLFPVVGPWEGMEGKCVSIS